MWRAVEDVASYSPPLLANSRRKQKLLLFNASSENLLHSAHLLLFWSYSSSGSSYSSCHKQVFQPVRSHNMTEEWQLVLPYYNKEFSLAPNTLQNIHVTCPLGPTNSQ